jgi:hypothetical protein
MPAPISCYILELDFFVAIKGIIIRVPKFWVSAEKIKYHIFHDKIKKQAVYRIAYFIGLPNNKQIFRLLTKLLIPSLSRPISSNTYFRHSFVDDCIVLVYSSFLLKERKKMLLFCYFSCQIPIEFFCGSSNTA